MRRHNRDTIKAIVNFKKAVKSDIPRKAPLSKGELVRSHNGRGGNITKAIINVIVNSA